MSVFQSFVRLAHTAIPRRPQLSSLSHSCMSNQLQGWAFCGRACNHSCLTVPSSGGTVVTNWIHQCVICRSIPQTAVELPTQCVQGEARGVLFWTPRQTCQGHLSMAMAMATELFRKKSWSQSRPTPHSVRTQSRYVCTSPHAVLVVAKKFRLHYNDSPRQR
jgi:hypothetical protein